jgi:hypothetical protein
MMLYGLYANRRGEMRLAGSGQNSVTMPGVRRSRRKFIIRFIRASAVSVQELPCSAAGL